ncbi:MAG: GNAT family N-acetyltransferase [Crocinitomicaceae bacterium]|nr:GNAT family N-acetyltransferase [Flavobacteriales bacterium]NQZ35968.1 GNAT family N-acetyltransferase [Crocinitomicaceae bacterium]PHR35217.1 MAG: GNAT family N-acetyltransferase [Fluviicola sp.]
MISLGLPHEIDAIIALTKRCGEHMRKNGIDQWDEDYPDRTDIENDIKTETLFAYRDDETIIGIVVLNESQEIEYDAINWLTDSKSRNLVVHRLAVDPDRQGKGIARMLMDHTEDYARQHQYDSIRLDTFSQNPRNQRFYTNRGYTDLGSVFLKYKKEHPYFCYELLLNQ